MIIGNKSDMASPPASSPKNNIPFMSTSAKIGTNVKRVFEGLTQSIL